MMKGLLLAALLVSVSISRSPDNLPRITGALLEHWQEDAPTSFLVLDSLLPTQFNEDIGEFCITGIEVTADSLNLYLLGIPLDDGIPFLLAAGGYRGEYNFAKSFAAFEEGEICIYFQMPSSARYSKSCYSWNSGSAVLLETDHVTGDPSLDALERVDEYLETGQIEEAINELNNMMYPGNYFNTDEMIARLLRTANRFALIASKDGNYSGAIEIFESLSGFLHGSADRYPTYYDNSDYTESNFSNYMGISEFVAIINNHAFFLEKTGDLERSADILRKVLRLDSSRMLAYLNSADVSWGLGEFSEAERFYITYLWMMTERGLASQIPSRVNSRTHLSIRDSGDIELSDNQEGIPPAIMLDSQGQHLPASDSLLTNSLLFSIPDFGQSEDFAIVAREENGDTLWVCSFEGVPLEWFHSPKVIKLSGGGYMVANSPDCFSTETLVHRLSESGSEIFSTVLESSFILDQIGATGEIFPHVGSFRETSGGDILATGSASLWFTSPKTSFVCLLDGETGEILWKVTDYGLGMAEISDVTESSSGSFVAVGVTGLCNKTPNRELGFWAFRVPFAVIIDSDGEIEQSVVYTP